MSLALVAGLLLLTAIAACVAGYLIGDEHGRASERETQKFSSRLREAQRSLEETKRRYPPTSDDAADRQRTARVIRAIHEESK